MWTAEREVTPVDSPVTIPVGAIVFPAAKRAILRQRRRRWDAKSQANLLTTTTSILAADSRSLNNPLLHRLTPSK